MARGYDDIDGIADMDDREIAELIAEEIETVPDLDAELIDVEVVNGFVRLSGRVGTEQELQQVESVVADVLGITNYSNELVVDELVRGLRSEAADLEATEAMEWVPQSEAPPERSSSEADHLVEDPAGDLFGSTDVQRAITRGQTYEPPTHPIQEGTRSRENH